ncbi:MAG: DUF2024 family protein [Pseudomonas sp.]|uniref:DUF2024 family protein n=1 Tax=Pseudomonas sp. TaxID=306 RepID=UPI003399D30B
MKVQVFDTHVHTRDGRYLHFDVLTEADDSNQAGQLAHVWLAEQGLLDADIVQSQCQFCHGTPATPAIANAIAAQGYCIIPLQGC